MYHPAALVCDRFHKSSRPTPRRPLPVANRNIQRHAKPPTPVVFMAVPEGASDEAVERAICTAGWQVRRISSSGALFSCETSFVTPSCLVLDVTEPRFAGLLWQDRPEMPVVCIINEANVAMTVHAMRAGALDVLAKPIQAEALARAVESALEHSAAQLTRDREARALRERYALLTLRERQVMALVVSGKLNKQIGGELGISEITVKAHRGRVMRKMDVRSLAALVHAAAKIETAFVRFERGGAPEQGIPAGQARIDVAASGWTPLLPVDGGIARNSSGRQEAQLIEPATRRIEGRVYPPFGRAREASQPSSSASPCCDAPSL